MHGMYLCLKNRQIAQCPPLGRRIGCILQASKEESGFSYGFLTSMKAATVFDTPILLINWPT